MLYRRTVPFPDRVLARDEDLVLHLHPHVATLARPVLVLLLTIGFGTFLLVQTTSPGLQLAVLLLAAAVLVLLVARPFLRWWTTHLVLTTHRVLVREGVLARSGRDVPLARITEVSFQRSLPERVVGSGTLVVESAGERGPVVVRHVPRVEGVQAALYQLIEDDDERDRDRDRDR